MKKILTLVLAIVLLATLCLTGCQPADKPTEPTKGQTTPTTKPTETTEPQLEEKTIQIWLGGSGKQKDSDKVWKAFNELLQQYVPNTTVEFTVFPFGEYKDNYTRSIAAEEAVDMYWGMWTISKPQEIKDGNIIALDDLIANYGKDIVEVLGQGVIDAHKWSDDGKVYFIPSWQGLYGNRHAVTVIKEIATLAGATWVEDTQKAMYNYTNNAPTAANLNKVLDQFELYMAAAKKAGKLGAGWNSRFGGFGYMTGFDYCTAKTGIDVYWKDDSFTVGDGLTGETYKAYLQRMASWYDKGYIRSDITSVEGLHDPKEGKIDDLTTIITVNAQANPEAAEASTSVAWGMDVEILPWTDHGEIIQGYDTGMIISYAADEPERAMMVLNAIYANPDLYNLLIYGIEGEHYTKNSDGSINTTYADANPSSEDAYGIQRWIIGSCKNAYISSDGDLNYYKTLEALESDPKTESNPFTAMVLDADAYADISAATSAVGQKYTELGVIVKGSAGWEAEYNKWVSESKAAGLDKIVAAKQAQVDAYVKANNITKWP